MRSGRQPNGMRRYKKASGPKLSGRFGVWWNNELLKAQEESDRLWRQEVENPNIFIDLTAEVHWDARGRRLLCRKGGLPSIGE